MPATACGAQPGTSAAEWFQRGLSLVGSSREQAASCFTDAALADPLWHEPPLQLGLLRASSPPYLTPLINRTLHRAARLALREKNTSAALTAHRTLGDAAYNSENWHVAAGAYVRALQLSPADCLLSFKAAYAQARDGDDQRAIGLLRAGLAEDHACVSVHHLLAQLLSRQGQLDAALEHARAAIELSPYEPTFEQTLHGLEAAVARVAEQPPATPKAGSECKADASEHSMPVGRGGKDSAWENLLGSAAMASLAVEESSTLSSTTLSSTAHRRLPVPPSLAPTGSCPKPAKGKAAVRAALLFNPFEEGCFHDDVRSNVRQDYHSCGQFNNVLASLLEALALSRLLCRTLILPGFFIRFGTRLTRVSPFSERWLPTSHFYNLSLLERGFHVRELVEWRDEGRGDADSVAAGRRRELPNLHARAEAHRAAQLRFFGYHNLSFKHTAPFTFPHFMQQQTELRWVSDDQARRGYFTHFDPTIAPRFWKKFGASSQESPLVAFDATPSVGLQLNEMRWDEALRWTRAHVRYNDDILEEARRIREALFGEEPYLAVHIRRGADRLHDFCNTGWGQRAFGWNITNDMCYPPTQVVAEKILALQKRWGASRVFLATDSPKPELFEDVLREHGVKFARYGQQGPAATLGTEFALPVDQMLCAAAPYFLGNVPSTVTATIVQERDNIGWSRARTDFFGFDEKQLRGFAEGWDTWRVPT